MVAELSATCLGHDLQELLAAEGLGDEVVGPVLHGAHRLLHRAEGGQENDVDVHGDGLDGAQQLQAGEPGHLEVREHEIHAATLELLEGGAAVGGQDHAIAGARQRALETLAQPGVVVGDQEGGGLRHGPLA
jgi:hypothetical protein